MSAYAELSALPVIDTMLVELVVVSCKLCRAPIAVELPDEDCPYRPSLERTARAVAVHNECFDAHYGRIEAAKLLAAENAKLCSWKTLCPTEYQKPLEWRYEGANRGNLAKLMAWDYCGRGLFVTGPAGKCKTRFIWQLLAREWDAGRTMAAHRHTDFRFTVSALGSNDQSRLLTFISGLRKVDILFLDDLGKGRVTPAAEEALFDLLDARMNVGKPTLYTSNMSIGQLEAQFAGPTGEGLMRRIVQQIDLIEF